MSNHGDHVETRAEPGPGWLSEDVVLEFAAVLTLVVVAIHTEGTLRWAVLPIVVVGAASRRLRLHVLLWTTIGLVRLIGQIPFAWYAIDNHQYLLTYWCFAMALALAGPRSLDVLRWNARLLVGLVFTFAALWKVISGDFLDGSLFEFILVAEDRVTTLSGPLLGIDPVSDADLATVVSVMLGYAAPQSVHVPFDGDVGAVPTILAVFTVTIEAAVAVVFLAPLRTFSWIRDAVLLVFLWTTYLVTPVVGFGMLLAGMGYVQSGGAQRRRAYLVTFAALPLFVAVTAVPRFPPGFSVALVGGVVLVAYLVWARRALLIAGCAALGSGLAGVLAGGSEVPVLAVGAGGGIFIVTLLDIAGRRPINWTLVAVGALTACAGLIVYVV